MSERMTTVYRCELCGLRSLDVCPPNWHVSVNLRGVTVHSCTRRACLKFLERFCSENGWPKPWVTGTV